MSDLISRQDVARQLTKMMKDCFPDSDEELDAVVTTVYEIPSAEPERKKGEWRHLGGDEWCCTNCGYVVSTEGAWERPKEQGKEYCEHCGADMKGEYE